MDQLEQHRNPKAYAALRESIASQGKVSKAIGVTVCTLSRRENGEKPVAAEAVAALLWLKDQNLFPADQAGDDESANEPRND